MLYFSGNEIDTAQAAKKANCSRYRIITAINSGELKATNIGYGAKKPRWAIDPADLDAWLNGIERSSVKYVAEKKEVKPEVHIAKPEPVKEEPKAKAFVRNPYKEKYEAMMNRLEELQNELLELSIELEEIMNI